ncbi:LamG domain-containing protein [Candidatus Nanohalobium constans]|uniref:Concanavalin A-like lectin/glucanases superfamily n=1 Tax=Candidatus Nanohalobium constans TaxID=2565781 RepID=A0A5Q0UFC1_9ARCH|nr:LamG domain-containing protein [Candidatus Nanohalobium constans]QGA80302.1 concanavalin A-like lectin/glucanases superfamily [Candidatus Nanohalobium constans]
MVKLKWNSNDFKDEQDSSGISDGIDTNGKLSQGYQHGSLTRGLVAYYPMEKGQGEVLLDGATGNHGQINPGTNGTNTSASDMWSANSNTGNNALSFDGTDDYVNLKTEIPPLRGEYTISAWINCGDLTSERVFLCPLSNNNISIRYDNSTDSLTYTHFGSSDNSTLNGRSPSASTWYHIVAVRDNPDVKLYINNTLEVKKSNSSNTEGVSGRIDAIGAIEGSSGPSSYHDGKIDDIRIYDRALSEPEIQALYNSGNGVQSGIKRTGQEVPSQNQGGISRYKLNGSVNDSWGENDGTDSTSTGFVDGVYDQAKEFDGSDDQVELPQNAFDSGDGSVTISKWIKTETTGTNVVPLSIEGVWVHRVNRDGNGKFSVTYTGSSADIISSQTTVNDGNWHHVVSTSDGSTTSIYVDGILENQQSQTQNTVSDLSAASTIGSNTGNAHYKGYVDDVRIYNQVLNPIQIEKLYNKGAYRISRGDTLQ